MYNCVNSALPSVFSDYFSYNCDYHNQNSRSILNVHIFAVCKSYIASSPFIIVNTGPCLWNLLSYYLKSVIEPLPLKFKTVFWRFVFNPLDAGRRLTDFSQTSYAAGSRLTYKTVNQRSGSQSVNRQNAANPLRLIGG